MHRVLGAQSPGGRGIDAFQFGDYVALDALGDRRFERGHEIGRADRDHLVVEHLIRGVIDNARKALAV